MPESHPEILLDTIDGYCEDRGWVEVIVSEDEARDALAEFCYDDDQPSRPLGAAHRGVWMRLVNPVEAAEDPEAARWVHCTRRAKTGIEFWEIQVR